MFVIVSSHDRAVIEVYSRLWTRAGLTIQVANGAVAAYDRPARSRAFTFTNRVMLVAGSGRFGPLDDRSVAELCDGASTWLRFITTGDDYCRMDDLIGPSAFAASDGSGAIYGIRDPIGLVPLFYRITATATFLSDRTHLCDPRHSYDRAFCADFIAQIGRVGSQTVWDEVTQVPSGHTIALSPGKADLKSYWSSETIATDDTLTLPSAGEEFRRLFERSIKRCVEPGGRTWSHLSGGLDSSSIVSVASYLHEREGCDTRLGGTITLCDSLGDGDEREFSDTVIERYAVRNECIADDWPWRAGRRPPPRTDEPERDYPFFARQQDVSALIRHAGGTSLLGGVGPDGYFPITPAHIPELFWRGRFRDGCAELVDWAMATNNTVWHVVVPTVVAPLLTRRCFAYLGTSEPPDLSDWVRPEFEETFGIGRNLAERFRASSRGSFYADLSLTKIRQESRGLSTWWAMDGVETRYPFLDLALVEFVLRLPWELRTNIRVQKPVLREAMQGILPDNIHQRAGKGGRLEPRICWAFRHERDQLARLLKRSVLADVGCIEPKGLLRAIDRCAAGLRNDTRFVYSALSLDTWLVAREGRMHE
jgi:asparagine synthase (glutamine-hydrolysing)